MICPELIVSRLFCQQLEANEAVLIKGVERYSNHIGYSKTFEWFSDHRDPTPRYDHFICTRLDLNRV